MATIINNPSDGNSDNSAGGLLVGVLIVLVLGGLFFVYLLPSLRAQNPNAPQPNGKTEINVQVPAPTTNTGTNQNPAPTTP